MTKQLDDKDVSFDEYKKRLNTLNDTYEKEIQELKKELKESKEYIDSDKKDKNMVLKKLIELTEENQTYMKEKQIIQQELNKKEQELANNKKIIDNLNIKIKSLKDNDELRQLIKEIEGSKNSRTPTKIPQSVRKRDYKAKTFDLKDFKKDSLPEYNEKSNRLENLEKEYQNATEEKYIINLNKIQNIEEGNFINTLKLEEIDIEQLEKDFKNDEFYE